MRRWWGVLLALPLAGVAALVLLVERIELAGIASARAGAALGRSVTIESLRVTPGRWLGIELRGAELANLPGGSATAMVSLARFRAELDLLSLFAERPVWRGIAAEGLRVTIERVEGQRNWRFGPPPREPRPVDYAWIPELPGLELADAEITYRTTLGQLFRTRLEVASLRVFAGAMLLEAEGAFNGAPARLTARLGSLAELRAAPHPLTVEATLASGANLAEFAGMARAALAFDGLEGRLRLTAPEPAPVLAALGAAAAPALPLVLTGQAFQSGTLWRLTGVEGTLAGEPWGGSLIELREGLDGAPDRLAFDLAFTRLDLSPRGAAPGPGGRAALPRPDPGQDPLLEARVSVEELLHPEFGARGLRLRARFAPGLIELSDLALEREGVAVTGSARLEQAPAGVAVSAAASAPDAEVEPLRRLLGLGPLPLSGRLDLRAVLDGAGEDTDAALAAGRLVAIATMRPGQGRVAREVIELGSTDLRLLFRTPSGTTPVSCLLAVVDTRGGEGEVAPLRIRAGAGTIAGSASFDLLRRRLDMVVGSEGATTGPLALDIPVRVHGAFADPEIAPAQWSAAGRARLAAAEDLSALPEGLREVVRASPCLGGRAGR